MNDVTLCPTVLTLPTLQTVDLCMLGGVWTRTGPGLGIALGRHGLGPGETLHSLY